MNTHMKNLWIGLEDGRSIRSYEQGNFQTDLMVVEKRTVFHNTGFYQKACQTYEHSRAYWRRGLRSEKCLPVSTEVTFPKEKEFARYLTFLEED